MDKPFLHQEYEVAQAGADIKEGSRKGRIGKIFATSFFSLTILLAISAVAFTIVFFISEVYGSSMMITLNPSYAEQDRASTEPTCDSVLVNRYMEPKRGDVIIVKHYWTSPKYNKKGELVTMEYFIKRLIGKEGDRIRFEMVGTYPNEHYILIRNDEPVDEWYLDMHWGKMVYYGRNIYRYLQDGVIPGSTPDTTYVSDFIPFEDNIVLNTDPDSPSNGKYEIVIKPGQIFFMGDNRGSDDLSDFGYHSYDCTAFGPQPKEVLVGVRIDTIKSQETLPSYVWRKIVQFFSFKWLF